eukprot:gene36571-47647_t
MAAHYPVEKSIQLKSILADRAPETGIRLRGMVGANVGIPSIHERARG